ncbi:hypothetical protein [Sulfurovum mangrovi]|uniref:hypothetical protein n=1 Tax=Sulfurovum mangrovi TaxID=2893889 RepID=UPI001E290092|nr:hypothetical protein [Sulfurovum mangrovi]UFH60469.1 hypothetical protein LN246_06325 [Sulfurovum mangrovi]
MKKELKIDHFELILSEGRTVESVKYMKDEIIKRSVKELEDIQDPEELLRLRKQYREDISSKETFIKQQKARFTKNNKQRDKDLATWNEFTSEFSELCRKHGVSFDSVPIHLGYGRTFAEKLSTIKPDSFVSIDNQRIPQKKSDSILDDDLKVLFEARVRADLLEQIIERKHKAMKELFSPAPE